MNLPRIERIERIESLLSSSRLPVILSQPTIARAFYAFIALGSIFRNRGGVYRRRALRIQMILNMGYGVTITELSVTVTVPCPLWRGGFWKHPYTSGGH
jgi:hypothetical protein